jgi:site-specific recombinase XerD
MSGRLQNLTPNRPDVIGFFPPEQERQSKYAAALNRVVAALRARAAPVDQDDVRGKRRTRKKPQDSSHTIRTYLKALELFSAYMQGKYGFELDPKDVSRAVAFEYMEWLMSHDSPNVHAVKTLSAGGDAALVFAALQAALKGSVTGEVNIQQIYEHLPPAAAERFDPKVDGFMQLHRTISRVVVNFRSIVRMPSTKQIRKKTGVISSKEERDPLRYRYSIRKRTKYSVASVSTYLSVLSSVWEALTEGENIDGGDAPLRYNPWRGPRGPLALARAKTREDHRRRKAKVVSNALVDAVIEGTVGTTFEARRNRAAMLLLIYTGMRAEELVGILRRDLVTEQGVLSVQIYGKGDKYRILPVYAEARDALTALENKLTEMSQVQSADEDERWKAAYAATLLQSKNAPIIPSLPRWGANQRDVDPATAATEPLDTSGLRAVIDKLAERAQVYDRQLRIVRPLTDEEKKKIHPHALRHYAATAAQEAGLPMEEVALMLGHEDVRTTQRYVHIPPRAITQFGIYVAQARSGAAVTPEEAQQHRIAKQSALEDENIVAAPADLKKQVPVKPKPQPVVRAPEPKAPMPEPMIDPKRSRKINLGTPVSSPDFAYDRNGDKLRLYLPSGYKADSIPKGQGILLTLRRGVASRLPWWTGRANRWKQDEMAPLASYFQLFANDTQSPTLKQPLEQLWQEILDQDGVTAASAFAEWVAEIIGFASALLFATMNRRLDKDGLPEEWVSYDEPVPPGEQVVRMHRIDKMLQWFDAHARSAEASVVRSPPSWMQWKGEVTVLDVRRDSTEQDVFRSSILVRRTPSFDAFFKPKTAEGQDTDLWKAGTGKDSKRARYKGKGGLWQYGIVTARQRDPLDPSAMVVTIEGDPMPDEIARLDASWDGGATEKQKRQSFYPNLAELEVLPVWFFADDPIGELPDDEKTKLRDWLDKLQGKKLSRVRVISDASELYLTIKGWQAAKAETSDTKMARLSPEEQIRRREVLSQYETQVRDASLAAFGVAVDPNVIVGRAGNAWAKQAHEKQPQAFEIRAPGLEGQTERALEQADREIQTLAAWAKLLPKGERRIFAYVQLKRGSHIPITEWGLRAPQIQAQDDALFAGVSLNWEDGTIVHSPQVKSQFFATHGTDSECVVRRMVRNIWERKKKHDFEYSKKDVDPAPPIHRDLLHRQVNSFLAYLVPCPSAMEQELRVRLEQQGAPVQFRSMTEALDEDKLGEIKGQAPQLRQWWLELKGEEEGETEQERRQEIEADMPQRVEFARPNEAKALRVVPNQVSLVFAEYWPV